MDIRRRDLLAGSLAGAGAWLLGGAPALAEAFAPKHDPVEVVTLGKTGIKLSRVGLGTGMRGGMRASNQTRMGQAKFTQLVRHCYEQGVRWFDLADLYGSHPFFAKAVEGLRRDDYTLVSKLWFNPGGVPEAERPDADVVVPRFLKEMKTDRIDLLLLHCMTAADWPTQMDKQMKLLDDYKRKGVVRAVGVSCHSLEALRAAVKEPWVDSVHARINPYQASMDGPPVEVAAVLRDLKRAGKGVVGMKMIGEGAFRNDPAKKKHTVDYVFNLGCVDTVTVGFERPAECDDFNGLVRGTVRRESSLKG